MPDIKFLNKSWAPRATATPKRPKPAITGPIFIPHTSKTATIPKKIIKYFNERTIQRTKALVSIFSSLEKIFEKGIRAWWINQKTNIVAKVLFIFWKYKPSVESISKYRVTARKARTIGRSLKGGIKASYKLSSISVDVFFTIFLILKQLVLQKYFE